MPAARRRTAHEPDAREYVCDGCDAHQVYGAEELILMYAEHAFA